MSTTRLTDQYDSVEMVDVLDPNTEKGSKERYLLGQNTHFRGSPLHQVTEPQLTGEKTMTNEMER